MARWRRRVPSEHEIDRKKHEDDLAAYWKGVTGCTVSLVILILIPFAAAYLIQRYKKPSPAQALPPSPTQVPTDETTAGTTFPPSSSADDDTTYQQIDAITGIPNSARSTTTPPER